MPGRYLASSGEVHLAHVACVAVALQLRAKDGCGDGLIDHAPWLAPAVAPVHYL